MHGYVVSVAYRYFCLYHPTIRIQRLFWKKNHVKKYVKNLELINKDKKKTGDVGFGVFSYKVTLLACGSGPAQIVFLHFTIKSNIFCTLHFIHAFFSLYISNNLNTN